MGKFCFSSVILESNYWKEVESSTGRESSEPEEERIQRRPNLQRPKPKFAVE